MNELTTNDNELFIPGLDDKQQAVKTFQEMATTYLPSLGVINSGHNMLKDRTLGLHPGDFIDYSNKTGLGEEVTLAVVTYRIRIKAIKGQKEFLEGMYIQRSSGLDFTKNPDFIEFTKKWAGNKIQVSQDLLVYCLETDSFLHFDAKGRLAEGGAKLLDLSTDERGAPKYFCSVKTSEKTGGDNSWYEIQVERLNKLFHFPPETKKFLDMFLEEKALDETPSKPQIASSRVI